jgi:assimilatory nitrate reductase catalytic subunit
VDEEYPLVLNTGRIRDQWHTMTRSGGVPRLMSHAPEPFVDMHAADALSFGVREGALVRVVTRWGRFIARARSSGQMLRGAIFVPIHWSDNSASEARAGALVNPSVDPISGEPEFKYTPARMEPFVVNWYGFVLTRRGLDTGGLAWWSRAQMDQCLRYEIAGRDVPGDWQRWARNLLRVPKGDDFMDYEDASIGKYRAAHVEDDKLVGCLCIGPQPELPSRTALVELFQRPRISTEDRGLLLGGRVVTNSDVTVCACFGVSRGAIEQAIGRGCEDTVSLGKALKAGTNCGSCVPELRQLLERRAALPA